MGQGRNGVEEVEAWSKSAGRRVAPVVRAVAVVVSSLLVAQLLVVVGALVTAAPVAATPAPTLGVYRAVTAVRLYDVQVPASTAVDLQVTGGISGVPDPAQGTVAVVTDLTAIVAGGGWGVVWEQGTPQPYPVASINYTPNKAITNLAVAKPSASGKVSYYNYSDVAARVIVDVVGYYQASSTGAGYAPLTQSRVYDSRPGPLSAGTVVDLRLRGVGGVPDDTRVTSVMVNLTVTGATSDAFLTVYERGTPRPVVASVSYRQATNQTSSVIAKLDASGYASIYAHVSANVVVDVVGYEIEGAGSRFRPMAGIRIMDTRYGTTLNPRATPLGACEAVSVQLTGVAGVPSVGVVAVAVNTTVADAVSGGFLTVWPTGSAQPIAASVSFAAGDDMNNLAFVQPGAGGAASFFNSCGATSSQLVLDVVGYFLNDTTGPAAPAISSTSHPDQNAWYPSGSFNASWPAPDDDSGIAGYAVSLTSSPGAEAPSVIAQTTTTYAATQGDGQWYLNVRAKDNAANWGPNARYGFRVDTSAPQVPAISSSSHPDQNAWYPDNTPVLSWSASDISGIAGYSYVMDQSPTTSPDTTSEGTATTWTSPARADGVWYFHLRAQNGSGSWSGPAHYKLQIDATASSVPTVSSTSHPDQNAWYPDNTPVLSWSASDISGIAGYSYVMDQSPTTSPDTTSEGTATTWTSPARADGVWYFHLRAQNGSGTWSGPAHYKLQIDATASSVPTVSSTSHPDQNAWYPDNTPVLSWSASDISGIAGYSYVMDQSPTTSPDTTSEGTATTWTSPARADGVWYFHLRAQNGSGTWSGPAHYKLQIDATASSVPTVSSTSHPDQNAWYPDNTPVLSWSASDISGIAGYSYVMDQSPTTSPDTTSEGTATTWTSPARADGVWYFHLRAQNGSGIWSGPAHYTLRIDTGRPAAPVASSPTHPSTTLWYPNANPGFTWTVPASVSPVTGYSWVLDQAAATDPDTTSDGTAPPASFTNVSPDGIWYFHVRARNAAGTWGPAGHRQVKMDVTNPLAPGLVVSLTHPAGVAVSNRQATLTWTPGNDATPGVAGYSWSFNQDQNVAADAVSDGNAAVLGATSPSLADGVSWFHVRTIDNAGNASTDKLYGPIVVDPAGPPGLSATLPSVAKAGSDELGLEQFYPYRRLDLGTATGFVQLRTGNLVVSQDETTVARQGLNAVVRRVYNSTDTRDPDGMGPGWRLSVSDTEAGLEGVPGVVTELDAGAGLVVANIVDAAGAVTGQLIEFTDGDGTTHRFVRPGGPGTRWESPPGVSLRLREVSGGFELVRPDGVIYRADNVQPGIGLPQWRITSVADRHGNRLTYGYAPVGTLGAMNLAKITHNRDDGQQVLVSFTYENTKLVSIKSLPDLSAPDPATGTVKSWERLTTLSYVDGRLSSVKRNNHPDAVGGAQLSDFSYAGGLLSGVKDGRRNTTTLAYGGTGTNAKLEVATDRRGKNWSFAYGAADANGGRVTTTTDPTGAKVRYTISGRAALADGRTAGSNILAIADDGTDAGTVSSTYAWVANRLVTSTDGVGNASSTEYNDLGLVTKVTRPAPNAPGRTDIVDSSYPKAAVVTTLSYRYPPGFSYAGCTEPASSGPVTTAGWCQMVGDLERSAGADNIAAQRRVTEFEPDAAGKVLFAARRAAPTGVASAADRIEGFSYFTRGGLCSADGPRGEVADVTRFGDAANTAATCAAAPDPAYGGYDASGRPPRVLDALGKASDVVHTPYGRVAKSTDRQGRVTTAVYDDRDNLVRTTDPVGSVTTMSYDANDNKLSETSPRGNATTTPGDDFETRFAYDNNDWATVVSWPGKDEAAPRAQVTTAYNDDGTKATDTNAVGAITEYLYFANRMLKQVKAPATTSGPKALTDYRYDTAGRVVRTIHPGTDAAGTSRPEELVDYTPQGDVSIRRETSATPGVWRTTRHAYNAHGESAQVAGPRTVAGEEERSEQAYNGFGQVELTRRRLVGRWLETPTSYDAAGNAVATSTLTATNEVLTTNYRYDALGRVAAQTTDPTNPGHKVAFTYDAEGAQLTRVDSRQTAGPATGACGEAGVSCETLRTTTNAYNNDTTVASSVSSDQAGQSLATCNFAGSNPASGYDADKHPLVVRTLVATTTCSGGTLEREVTMSYDSRGLLSAMTQKVRGDSGLVTRSQSFEHRPDTTVSSATHAGRTTTYGRSPAGWSESVSAEREPGTPKVSTFAYSPAGAPTGSNLGSGTATSTRAYTPDGMAASLVWSAAGTTVRSHTNLAYDVGGLRTAEAVAVVHPPTATGTDPGGPASYAYDLARRLVSYTSPYKAEPTDTAEPTVAYGLDDGANITNAKTTVGGQTRVAESSSYPGGRLATRSSTSTPTIGAPITADTAFSYSPLGEETQRTTTATVAGLASTTTTDYDAAGHVASALTVTPATTEDVDYLYDGADHLLARRAGAETTLYFYWGPGSTLAEETDGAGQSLARYVVDGAEPVAQHSFRRTLGGGKDPTDTAGTWAWLLDDPAGNVATTIGDNGAVLSQAAFDPYGVPEATGNSKAPGPDAKTSLGFQSALTDPTTAKVILGPRQYDPKTARFTNPDVFVGAGADLALGTDPLTGNRYLFAGANPVAYYEDGHGPCSLLGHNPAKRGEKHGGCRGGGQARRGARVARSAGQAALIAAAVVATLQEAIAEELTGGFPVLSARGPRSVGAVGRRIPGVVENTARMAEDWLGPNVRQITNRAGDKIFLSKNGTRRIRFDINRPDPHISPHAHVEELINGKWVGSKAIFPRDLPQR